MLGQRPSRRASSAPSLASRERRAPPPDRERGQQSRAPAEAATARRCLAAPPLPDSPQGSQAGPPALAQACRQSLRPRCTPPRLPRRETASGPAAWSFPDAPLPTQASADGIAPVQTARETRRVTAAKKAMSALLKEIRAKAGAPIW